MFNTATYFPPPAVEWPIRLHRLLPSPLPSSRTAGQARAVWSPACCCGAHTHSGTRSPWVATWGPTVRTVVFLGLCPYSRGLPALGAPGGKQEGLGVEELCCPTLHDCSVEALVGTLRLLGRSSNKHLYCSLQPSLASGHDDGPPPRRRQRWKA